MGYPKNVQKPIIGQDALNTELNVLNPFLGR